MDMDWKIIAAALVLAVVISTTVLIPASLAAGSGNNSKNQTGNSTQTNKTNQNSKSNKTSTSNNQSQGYMPLGGPAGKGSKIKGAEPNGKGWVGASSSNPWVYGPSVYPRRQAQNFWKNLYGQAPYSSAGLNKT